MNEDKLISRLEAGVLHLRLNRPERRNAMDPELMRLLRKALAEAAEDSEIRCVLLSGEGQDFCTGGDVVEAKNANKDGDGDSSTQMNSESSSKKQTPSAEEMTAWLNRSMESARLLHQMPKPTVAAVQGNVVGAGVGLATACDFRIAADNVRFMPGFLKVGYSGDFGGTYFLTRIIGTARAREAYMLNQRIEAGEAKALGLVTEVVDAEELESHSLMFAGKIAAGPPIALSFMKQNLNAAEHLTLEQCFELEARHQNACSSTKDSKEAIKALFEKREPEFKGE